MSLSGPLRGIRQEPTAAAGLGSAPPSPRRALRRAVARWSSSGDAGQRVLSRKDPRVSGLVAVALALHGLTMPARNTGAWFVGV
ncbi:MAG: hypothetical protein M3Q22_14325 [Actinomycetota bacterium]|nr:hypothetical protein [Actinomycetota bacterium]